MRSTLIAIAAALVAIPLMAQTPDSAAVRARARLEALLNIPHRADELRRAGVHDSAVRSVLDILTKNRVEPEESERILTAHRDAAREHGPTDNFGAFVQQQLDSGKRGQELAAAIRAEHRAHGKGKPNVPGARSKGKRPDSTATPRRRPPV